MRTKNKFNNIWLLVFCIMFLSNSCTHAYSFSLFKKSLDLSGALLKRVVRRKFSMNNIVRSQSFYEGLIFNIFPPTSNVCLSNYNCFGPGTLGKNSLDNFIPTNNLSNMANLKTPSNFFKNKLLQNAYVPSYLIGAIAGQMISRGLNFTAQAARKFNYAATKFPNVIMMRCCKNNN